MCSSFFSDISICRQHSNTGGEIDIRVAGAGSGDTYVFDRERDNSERRVTYKWRDRDTIRLHGVESEGFTGDSALKRLWSLHHIYANDKHNSDMAVEDTV